MRRRVYISGVVALFLVFALAGANLCLHQHAHAPLYAPARHSDTALALPDLDGDGLSDHATLDLVALHPRLLLYSSQPGELTDLPFAASGTASGIFLTQ